MSKAPATFADFILLHGRTQPEKPAIILSDRVATYGMLAQGMSRVEAQIRALGLAPGDLVCITIDNAIRHIIVAAALFRLGHPVMSAVTTDAVIALQLPIKLFLHQVKEPLVPGLRQVLVSDGWFGGEGAPSAVPSSGGFADDNAICRVVASSGTTGRPKAISLSVKAFNHKLDTCYTTLNYAAWDRLLCLPSLASDFGFKYAAHVLRAGKTLLRVDSARDALQMISAYCVEALVASPQQLRDMVTEHKKSPIPCHSLNLVRSGGSFLTRSLLMEIRARLCGLVVNAFGSTEAGTAAVALTDSLMDVDGAIGFIEPGAEVEIVDEADKVLGAGTEGILRIRTPSLGQPFPPDRADAHSGFRDGWFYPGDRARIAPGGLLVLTGRVSEVINSGGVKIAPEMVEEVVLKHDQVEQAAAFGAMDASGIEEIYLAVKLRAPVSEQEIINWCLARKLAVVRVFVVDEIPKTSMGKIRRADLKRQLMPPMNV